jgi:predicted DNA-binding antitoxin AbrB/MazE fold protein
VKAVRVVFKNGVFVPKEECPVEEGTEGLVVFCPKEEKPLWWEKLKCSDKKKEAVKRFLNSLKVPTVKVVGVNRPEGEVELFVIVEDERESVKPVMESGLKTFEETGEYLPIQVISVRRLRRWEELKAPVREEIESGVRLK